jgi:hypothetical protein
MIRSPAAVTNWLHTHGSLDVRAILLEIYHVGTCVQLCMSFIDQPSQIPEPYDLFFLNRGRYSQVN